MGRFVDFDAAWEAIAPSRAVPKFKIMGEEVTLPADKPVALVLLEHQLNDPDERAEVTYERLLTVLAIVLGQDVIDRLVADGIGKDKLVGLLRILGPAWSLPPEDAPGEAQPPATGEPPS